MFRGRSLIVLSLAAALALFVLLCEQEFARQGHLVSGGQVCFGVVTARVCYMVLCGTKLTVRVCLDLKSLIRRRRRRLQA
jgi:hypothetical protein